MKIEKGNVLNYIGKSKVVCVTTNGIVKKDGELVMGAGCAKAFKLAFPQLPRVLGNRVSVRGNIPILAGIVDGTYIVSFPTKENYKDESNIELIVKSAMMLVELMDKMNVCEADSVYVPSPGTGLGGLSKEVVYSRLTEIFDDRFVILEL